MDTSPSRQLASSDEEGTIDLLTDSDEDLTAPVRRLGVNGDNDQERLAVPPMKVERDDANGDDPDDTLPEEARLPRADTRRPQGRARDTQMSDSDSGEEQERRPPLRRPWEKRGLESLDTDEEKEQREWDRKEEERRERNEGRKIKKANRRKKNEDTEKKNSPQQPVTRQLRERKPPPVEVVVEPRDILTLPRATIETARAALKLVEVFKIIGHRTAREIIPDDGEFQVRYDVRWHFDHISSMADGVEQFTEKWQEEGNLIALGEEQWKVLINKEDLYKSAADKYWVFRSDMKGCDELIEEYEKHWRSEYPTWRRNADENEKKQKKHEETVRRRKDIADAKIVRPTALEESEEPEYRPTMTHEEKKKKIAIEDAMDVQSNKRYGTREKEDLYLNPSKEFIEETAFKWYKETEKEQERQGNRDIPFTEARLAEKFKQNKDTWIRIAEREIFRRGRTIRSRREREAQGEVLLETSEYDTSGDEVDDEESSDEEEVEDEESTDDDHEDVEDEERAPEEIPAADAMVVMEDAQMIPEDAVVRVPPEEELDEQEEEEVVGAIEVPEEKGDEDEKREEEITPMDIPQDDAQVMIPEERMEPEEEEAVIGAMDEMEVNEEKEEEEEEVEEAIPPVEVQEDEGMIGAMEAAEERPEAAMGRRRSTRRRGGDDGQQEEQRADEPAVEEQNEYICKFCDKKLNNLSHLQYHTNAKHLKVAPFKCRVCAKGFTTSDQRRIHLKKAHKLKAYACQCGLQFAYKVKMNDHLEANEGHAEEVAQVKQ